MTNRTLTYSLLAAVLLSALIFVGCGGTGDPVIYQNVAEQPSWSDDGRIAFASYGGDGLLYIYRIDDDGSNQHLLTPTTGEGGRHPSFSPDGQQIAISSRRGDATPLIYLIDAEEGDRETLRAVTADTGQGADFAPSFHPDGERIVYTSTRENAAGDIRIINTDGTGDTALLATAAAERWGTVSPDGNWLAYQSDEGGATNIWRLDLTDPGATPVQLTDTPYRDEAPSWSPDGSQIAFHSDRQGIFDIFIMDADGGNQVAVTGNEHSDGFPVFDPGNGRLAIVRERVLWTIPALPWGEWTFDNDGERLTRRR